jgi:TRAP-type C4-dicarboxylate transport system permease small subunit
METAAKFISRLFGWSLIGLSAFVALETVMRKAFNTSMEGADELGGYVLAIGSSLAFVVALADRGHIRIDFVHRFLPRAAQAALDWLAAVSLALLGAFVLYVGRFVILDTLSYGSTAPTPWATPLIWPQGLWYAALCLFTLVSALLALRATRLLATGRLDRLTAEFNPKGVSEEIAAELADQKRR